MSGLRAELRLCGGRLQRKSRRKKNPRLATYTREMADFPAPTRRAKTAYRTNDAATPESDAPQKTAVVVTRPEPPRELDAPEQNATHAPNMTKDEIAALLAVTETNQLTKWARVGNRAKRAAIPVALVSTLLGLSLGTLASLVPVVLGIAFCAWPLVTQKNRGWA